MRAAHAAAFVIAVVLVVILIWGLPYYTAPLARRVRDPHHAWLKPSGAVGQPLGLLALGLFLFLWLYPLRKKIKNRPQLGALSTWLDVHVVAGMLVPVVAAVHAGVRFEGIIGLGYLSMFIVCLSGFFGRYLYVHIPRSRTGIVMSLEEVAAERRRLIGEIAEVSARRPEEIEACLTPAPRRDSAARPAVAVLGEMARDDWDRRRAIRALRRELASGRGGKAPRDAVRRVVKLARREMALAQQARMLDGAQRLFRWWHAAHRPFAITALIAVVLHVAVAIAMGQTWFR